MIRLYSKFNPLWQGLRTPHDGSGLDDQDEADLVSGIVIDSGSVCRSKRSGAVRHTPCVPAPDVGIRNEVSSSRRSVSYSRNTPLRAI